MRALPDLFLNQLTSSRNKCEHGLRPPHRADDGDGDGDLDSTMTSFFTLQKGKLLNKSRASWRTTGLVVLLALGLLFGTAGTAAAQNEPTVGSGAGPGYEYAPDLNENPDAGEPCPPGTPTAGFQFDYDTFVLNHASTYKSVDATGADVATFDGEAIFTITTGQVVQAPHGSGPECNGDPLVLGPAPIDEVVISSTVGVGSIYCDNVREGGTYTRVSEAVVFDFVVLCDITGPPPLGSVTDVPVRHVVEGTQTACPPSPPAPPPGGCGPVNPEASSIMDTAFEAYGPA